MGFPSFDNFRNILSGRTRQAVDDFSALMQGWLGKEHKDDGAHGAVTVDTIAERGRSFGMGMTQPVPYSQANFSPVPGNWTVGAADQDTFNFSLVGDRMTVTVTLFNTDFTGATNIAEIVIPGGFLADETVIELCWLRDGVADVGTVGRVQVARRSGVIRVLRLDEANFNVANVDLSFSLSFKVA